MKLSDDIIRLMQEREEQNHKDRELGLEIISVLGLKYNEKTDRVPTDYGDKTPVGLAKTIRRLVKLGE